MRRLLVLSGALLAPAPSVFDSIQKDVAPDDGPKVHSALFSLRRSPRVTDVCVCPQYNVQLMTGALRMASPAPPSVVMTKKGGKKYRCHLPSTANATVDASSSISYCCAQTSC